MPFICHLKSLWRHSLRLDDIHECCKILSTQRPHRKLDVSSIVVKADLVPGSNLVFRSHFHTTIDLHARFDCLSALKRPDYDFLTVKYFQFKNCSLPTYNIDPTKSPIHSHFDRFSSPKQQYRWFSGIEKQLERKHYQIIYHQISFLGSSPPRNPDSDFTGSGLLAVHQKDQGHKAKGRSIMWASNKVRS